MRLYMIRAKALLGQYVEVIEAEDGFEEKANTFIRPRTKVSKKDIGKVKEGMYHGAFYAWVQDKSDIQMMRSELRKTIIGFNQKQLEQFQLSLEACHSFDTNAPCKIRYDDE